jgi:hypothetical protein
VEASLVRWYSFTSIVGRTTNVARSNNARIGVCQRFGSGVDTGRYGQSGPRVKRAGGIESGTRDSRGPWPSLVDQPAETVDLLVANLHGKQVPCNRDDLRLGEVVVSAPVVVRAVQPEAVYATGL